MSTLVCYVLFLELGELGSQSGDLSHGAQDVVPLLGVFAEVGDLPGLGQQRPDVLLPLRPCIGVCKPVLQGPRSKA